MNLFSFMRLRKATGIKDPPKGLRPRDILVQQKYDGFKIFAVRDAKGTRLYTRRGLAVTARVPSVVAHLDRKLRPGQAVLGEMTYQIGGQQNLQDMQRVLGSAAPGAIEKTQAMGGRIVFYVYDMLEDGGVDLRGEPLRDRMAALRRLALGGSGLVRQAKNYTWAARKRAIEESIKGGGEGIVIKSLLAPYRYRPSGESEPWGDVWKYKAPGVAAHTEDVILRSYTKGKEKLIFKAYVYRQQKLTLVGKLSGLDKATERKVKALLDKGKSVVAEVSYQERLPSGKFRHMGWIRLRPDKPARSAVANPALNADDLVKFIMRTNAIEGYKLKRAEVREAVEGVRAGYPISYVTSDPHIVSSLRMLEYLGTIKRMDANTIRELHRQQGKESIEVGAPGMYRTTEAMSSGGKKYSAGAETGAAMQWWEKQSFADPFQQIAVLMEIHPFEDGNGRVGRMALLWLNGMDLKKTLKEIEGPYIKRLEASIKSARIGRRPWANPMRKKKSEEPVWSLVIDSDVRPILDSVHSTPVGAYARQLELQEEEGRKIMIFSPAGWNRYQNRRKSSGLPKVRRRVRRVTNPRRSKVKDALSTEALRFKVFGEFATRYWNDCARGIYWVAVNSEDYEFDDREAAKAKAGKFTVGCNPEFALSGANAKKEFVAELNVNRLSPGQIAVRRGTDGAQIKLLSLDSVEILRVIDADRARRAFKYQQSLLPSSKDQLKSFWVGSWDREQERLQKAREKDARVRERAERKEARERRAERKEAREERAKKKGRKNPTVRCCPVTRAIPAEINQPG